MPVAEAWDSMKLKCSHFEKQAEQQEVNDGADGADEAEEDEADGDVAADELVENELEVFEADDEVELALAVLAEAEVVGDFADADLAIGRRGRCRAGS